MYPPGQFSAWNRPSMRAAWLGHPGGAPDDAEPGYSQLAVSDPSADATSTQTWAAIETGQHDRLPSPPGASTAAAPVPGVGAPGMEMPAGLEAPGAGAPPAGPGHSGEVRAGQRGTRDREQAAGQGRRSPGAAAAHPGQPGRSQRKRRHGRGRMLLAGAAAVAVLAAGAGAYTVLRSGQVSPRPAGTAPPTPAQPTPSAPSAPPGHWKFIQSRADDPRPLSLEELFPARFAAGGLSARRTAERKDTNCAHAVLGAKLKAAVTKAHCKQGLRATYLSTNRRLMATIGVLNLIDAAASERVGKATGATEFIDSLPASKGPTHNIKKGTGIEEPVVMGHYLIMIWAEYANLHRPSSAAKRQQLEQFAAHLIEGTVNKPLSTRMVTGKPA